MPLAPLMPGPPDARRVLLEPSVATALSGPWASPRDEERLMGMRALLESFLQGDLFTVRFPPAKNARVMIALLEPSADEVWEFRARRPHNVRLFGRFAGRDLFIATNWRWRENLPNADGIDDRWRDEILTSKATWNRLFPSYAPYNGTEINDYLSNAILLE
jgi:hypothetical protein